MLLRQHPHAVFLLPDGEKQCRSFRGMFLEFAPPSKPGKNIQKRLSDLIGPYWSAYGIVYRVLQPLLDNKYIQ